MMGLSSLWNVSMVPQVLSTAVCRRGTGATAYRRHDPCRSLGHWLVRGWGIAPHRRPGSGSPTLFPIILGGIPGGVPVPDA